MMMNNGIRMEQRAVFRASNPALTRDELHAAVEAAGNKCIGCDCGFGAPGQTCCGNCSEHVVGVWT